MQTIEFVVKGRPKTYQAARSSLNRWKQKVRDEATESGAVPTADNDLSIYIVYFYDGKTRIDTDNISKPICDALQGVVYHDDSQVIDRRARILDINGSYTIRGAPPLIVIAIIGGIEFVFVRICNIGAQIAKLI
ncbi:MAG: RusA family crossover junction endodeoxyribonuclease [Chloroflexi bacterium]|nr:RusA family crossover junction endodeoxyribonuclease [Chloroflexota bacterium]